MALAAMACAQPRYRSPYYYVGVHGGVLMSMMQFTPTVENTTPLLNTVLLSPNGGLVFRYSGHKSCGLQLEVNYMQRGWREKNMNSGVDYTRQLHYIEVPLLTHIYFGSARARGFLNLGPQFGYCFMDKESGNRNPKESHQYGPIDNRFDWGVAGGLGFYYRSRKAGLYQLEARFNYSLGTVFSSKVTDYFSRSNAMNLSVNIGYFWEFNKKK